MQLGQVIRRLADGARALWRDLLLKLRLPAQAPRAFGETRPTLGVFLRRRLPFVLVALFAFIVLYYALGALLMGRIDDDPAFDIEAGTLAAGERASVALAAALLDREVNVHGWVANDPFFLPTALLDNMANYQLGIVAGLARFTTALHRTLGKAGVDDSTLRAAAMRLSRSGTVWLWDWSQPLRFIGRSEAQYREALVLLESYNLALGEGGARFPDDAASLGALLREMMASLSDASERLASTAESASVLFSPTADDALYFAKGVAYANAILLKGLGRDYARVVEAHALAEAWTEAEAALKESASLRPYFVINAAPDAFILPSHLLNQGFRIFRARRALERVVAKLPP